MTNSSWQKIALAVLILMYGLALGAALFTLAFATKKQAPNEVRVELVRHSVRHGIVLGVCIGAFFLYVCRSKMGALATGFAGCVAASFAIKAFLGSMLSGLHLYNLLEPLVVLPCAFYLVLKSLKARRGGVKP